MLSNTDTARTSGSPEDTTATPGSLDDALADTFPASDPVAATAAADADDVTDVEDIANRRRSSAADDDEANDTASRRPSLGDDEAVHFPTSRRAGAGTDDDDDRTVISLRSNAVQMLQADHAQLFLAAQKFKPRLSFDRKRAIVDSICITLDIHLQLKEELFYPALSRVVAADDVALDEAMESVATLRDGVERLRGMRPWDADYDDAFLGLMNQVLHGIAEEETHLFPLAYSRMADHLDRLGAQISHRRMQLVGPHLAVLTMNTLRTLPFAGLLAGAGAFAGGLLLARSLISRHD